MESKNILSVIIAVCALFIVVFVIGLWVSMPYSAEVSMDQNSDNPAYEILEYGVSSPEVGPMATKSPEDLQQSMMGNSQNPGSNMPGTDKPGANNITIYENKQELNTNESVKSGDGEVLKKDLPTTWIERPKATTVPTQVPAPKKTAVPQKSEKVTEYWIQAGSFTKKSNAESRSAIIKDHGFAPQIQTREINGATQYRVRIGPYENKQEAEKFLNWLKVLDGLEESYISQVTRTRSL
ncbi:MAG: SPOR domain-containing protein [Spirochaetales bacterium]|nr:SPOR domain-containing protein [Spirochaetales bacterium]